MGIDPKQVTEHAWAFYIACTLLGGAFLWIFKRYINEGIAAFKEAKTELLKSVTDLYDKYNETREDISSVSNRVSKLEGEHNALTKLGGHQ